MPHWLRILDVPLFVSHRRLKIKRKLPVARVGWALDSGGFTELSMFGRWRTTPGEYVEAVERYASEIGRLEWAAPMDWMVEPFMLKRTGRTIAWHQGATVENLLELRALAPALPWVPVLQGWELGDYLACVERYESAGVDVTAEALVGVGSVCRRQSAEEIGVIFGELSKLGIACHGFGVKMLGVRSYGHFLTSADSMAWSYNARRNPPLPGCPHAHCSNCERWALQWRDRLLASL